MTVQLDEVKGKLIPLESPRHPFASPSHSRHSEHKQAVAAKKAARGPTRSEFLRNLDRSPKMPKEIDTSHPALHKALENHLGGSFEHFEMNPKHTTVTDKDGKRHAAVHLTVTHSYTHEDMGMHPDEMQDTAETHRVTAVRKEGKYHIMHRMSNPMHESTELEGVEMNENRMGPTLFKPKATPELKKGELSKEQQAANDAQKARDKKKASTMSTTKMDSEPEITKRSMKDGEMGKGARGSYGARVEKEFYEIGDLVTVLETEEYGKIIDILEDDRIVIDTTRVISKTGGIRTVGAKDIDFYKSLAEELQESLVEFNTFIRNLTEGKAEEETTEIVDEDEEEFVEDFDYTAYLDSFGESLSHASLVQDMLKQTDMSIVEAREFATELMLFAEKKCEDEDSDDEPKKGKGKKEDDSNKKAFPFAKKDKSDEDDSDEDDDSEDEDEDSETHQDFTKGDKKSK